MLSLASRPFALPAIVLLAGLLAAGFIPGQDANAGGKVEPKKYVTGWLPYWQPDAAARSVRQNASVFDDASPFVFDAISTSRIDLKLDADDWRQMRAALRQSGVDNIATVATDMSAADFARILRSPDRRSAHARALVKLVDRYNLDGIDLDYESINFGSSADKATIRAKYPVLVRDPRCAVELARCDDVSDSGVPHLGQRPELVGLRLRSTWTRSRPGADHDL